MFCATWYDLHNLRNMKNNGERVLLLIKFHAGASILLKVKLLHRRFSCLTKGTKSCKASHMH